MTPANEREGRPLNRFGSCVGRFLKVLKKFLELSDSVRKSSVYIRISTNKPRKSTLQRKRGQRRSETGTNCCRRKFLCLNDSSTINNTSYKPHVRARHLML